MHLGLRPRPTSRRPKHPTRSRRHGHVDPASRQAGGQSVRRQERTAQQRRTRADRRGQGKTSRPADARVDAQTGDRHSRGQGRRLGRHEGLRRASAGHRREVQDGADSRRQVPDGQPGDGKGTPAGRRPAARGRGRALLDGRARGHLGRIRVVVPEPRQAAAEVQQDRRPPIATSWSMPWPCPRVPIRRCRSAWARKARRRSA